MFTSRNRNLRFIEEPEGEESGAGPIAGAGDDDLGDIDFSNFGVDPETEEPAAAGDTATNAEGKTPAVWDPILSALPDDATRAMVKPHLQEWEKNTTQQFQKIRDEYAPWKRFKERNIPPEALEAGYALTQRIDSNPVEFMEHLKGALVQAGLIQEAQQVQQQINAEKDGETVEGEVDPVEELRQQQTEFFQRIEQQRLADEQREIQRQADQQTDADLAALESKYGTLSAPLKHQVFQQALVMGQTQQRYVPLEEAFNAVQQFINHARKTTKRAPQVMPPGGGLPAPTSKSVGEMTPAERRAAAVAVVARMQEGNS